MVKGDINSKPWKFKLTWLPLPVLRIILVGVSNSVTQLINFFLGEVTLDNCSSHNYVTSLQDNKVSSVIYALNISGLTIFDNFFENEENKRWKESASLRCSSSIWPSFWITLGNAFRLMSIGKCSSRPIFGIMRRIYVLSIGSLFQTWWASTLVKTKI